MSRVTCARSLATPITFGFFRPEICLPARALACLQHDEIEALFAHELAHALRRDPAWLAFYRALEIVLFFQPLNRTLRVRLQDEAEYLCDDWAVVQIGERVPLASCLTEIAGWIVGDRRPLPAPGMAARGTRLALRVRRLLDEERRPESGRCHRALLLIAGPAAASVALLVPGVSAEIAGVSAEVHVARAESQAEIAAHASSRSERSVFDRATPATDAKPCEGDTIPPASESVATQVIDAERAEVSQALDLTLAADELEQEIGTLEDDWAALRAEIAQRSVPEPLQRECLALENRLETLRTQRARLQSLIELEIQRALAADPEPASGTLTIQDEKLSNDRKGKQ